MNTYLGIEFGSTRIKAVLIDETHTPVDQGSYTWQSRQENGIWTYDLSEAITGMNAALAQLGPHPELQAVGISGMMHGYLAFDADWNLLVPFRTWQNTITAQASEKLTQRFGFHIPQRWSIAHLYQAMLNGEEHVSKIAHITTLAGYIHYRLTGVNAIGVGEASGMFPIDSNTLDYDQSMLRAFQTLVEEQRLPWQIADLLPRVLAAGAQAGTLSAKGAALLNNLIPEATPFAPAEGDAGTGMVATNSIAPKTGNVSAGTSIFSMIVLEKPLQNLHREIDIVTTPAGSPVAMVHCNNCTGDSNAWVSVLGEAASLFGAFPSGEELYTRLYEASLTGDADCGGVLVCNYIAGEGVTHMDQGRPLVVRQPNCNFTLANFFRATLYSTMATLKLGMDILSQEDVRLDRLTGHGGLFKTPVVGQKYLAAACGVPVTVMETAGEGGAYGMALLAAFSAQKANGQTLDNYLQHTVFAHTAGTTLSPDPTDVEGFTSYTNAYKQLLAVEQTAIDSM